MTERKHWSRSGSRSSGGFGRARVMTGGRTRIAVAPPLLTAGRVRCPVCRNTCITTASGDLRRHSDLHGDRCYNRLPIIETQATVRPVMRGWEPTPSLPEIVIPSDHCPSCGRKTQQNKDGGWRKHRVIADDWTAPYCKASA